MGPQSHPPPLEEWFRAVPGWRVATRVSCSPGKDRGPLLPADWCRRQPRGWQMAFQMAENTAQLMRCSGEGLMEVSEWLEC